VFSVCGVTQSGKTTTIERIIRELSARGYRVGSVKEIHNEQFAIDPDPSSNTRRHRLAGAGLVCARGLLETDFLFPEKLGIEKILSLYENEYDWVVMEGVRESSIPMIAAAHGEEDLREKWSDMTFCISGRIASQIKEYRGRPAIDALTNITELADLLESTVPDRPETVVFRSKRNTVILRGGVVEKRVASVEAASFEAAMLEKLYAAGISVPKLITSEGCVIKMGYVAGETLPAFLTRLEKTPDLSALLSAADETIRWFEGFYRAVDHDKTGEIRGDVNGRNFLYNGGCCRSLDFEERTTGAKEQDIGRLIAYVITYRPPNTPVKTAFADRLLRAAVETFDADTAAVIRFRDQELAAMRVRRGYTP